MKKRLQNVLAHAGVASRRHSAEIIVKGMVRVDGRIVREPGLRVDPASQEIVFNGRVLSGDVGKRYILLNKPAGFITTVKDTHGRRKVVDLVGEEHGRLYPVGRLDKDTTGLIILTNDGDLAHRLSHPSFEIEKSYRAGVKGGISSGDIKRLEEGVCVEGKKTSPCRVKVLKSKGDSSVLEIIIHEGRKRQVRRMVEAIGARVVNLERYRYAGLSLKGLEQGQWRDLTALEIKRLKELVQ